MTLFGDHKAADVVVGVAILPPDYLIGAVNHRELREPHGLLRVQVSPELASKVSNATPIS